MSAVDDVKYVDSQYLEHLAQRHAEELDALRAKVGEWQSSAGCVGTFCKADILLARNEELRAEVERLRQELEFEKEAYISFKINISAKYAELESALATARDKALEKAAALATNRYAYNLAREILALKGKP